MPRRLAPALALLLAVGCGSDDASGPDAEDGDPQTDTDAPGGPCIPAPEVCNGADDDCDALVDDADPDVMGGVAWYADDDGDGEGAGAELSRACTGPESAVSNAQDCDDGDPLLNRADADADGLASCDGDCDDADPATYPGAPEVACGPDHDCDPAWDATFAPLALLPASPGSPSIGSETHLADLDGDGDGDVLVFGAENGVVLRYENLGGGIFAEPWPLATNRIDPNVVVADFDGDGLPDMVIGFADDRDVFFYRNTGGLTFADEAAFPGVPGIVRQPGAADLDGDGDLDVYALRTSDEELVLFQNLGGTFAEAFTVARNVVDGMELEAADLDDDGDVDLVLSTGFQAVIAAYENRGGAPGVRWPVDEDAPHGAKLALADLDGDRLPEVITFEGEISVYPNLGGLAYGSSVAMPVTAGHLTQLAAGDLDGDGDADLATVSSVEDRTTWHENTGGVLGAGVDLPGGHTPIGVEIADVDGDGRPDLLVALQTPETAGWYRNICTP